MFAQHPLVQLVDSLLKLNLLLELVLELFDPERGVGASQQFLMIDRFAQVIMTAHGKTFELILRFQFGG